jgi:hypothetical protein
MAAEDRSEKEGVMTSRNATVAGVAADRGVVSRMLRRRSAGRSVE